MIGMDTTSLIDLFKGNESIKELLEHIEEPVALNQASYLELMFGLNLDNAEHRVEEEYYDNLFNYFINFNLSFNSCKKAREILWFLQKQGKVIDRFDCMVAGIFLANGVNKIITKNIKHFENIKGLKVIGY